jgi:glutathione S-transferase
MKEGARAKLSKHFDALEQVVAKQDYLTGAQFTVADAYLFTVLGWVKFSGLELAKWPALTAYADRVSKRPAVREAMVAEGLIKAA